MRHHFAYLSTSEFYNWGCSSCCPLLSFQLVCRCPLFYIHTRPTAQMSSKTPYISLLNSLILAPSCPSSNIFLYIELCKKMFDRFRRNFKLSVISIRETFIHFTHRNKSIYAFDQKNFDQTKKQRSENLFRKKKKKMTDSIWSKIVFTNIKIAA